MKREPRWTEIWGNDEWFNYSVMQNASSHSRAYYITRSAIRTMIYVPMFILIVEGLLCLGK